MTKRKLLIVTSTFPRWRDDTDPPFVYELARRLFSDFDITVHTPHYSGAKTREVMGGIKVYRFRYFFGPFEKLAGGTGILATVRKQKLFFALVPFFLVAQFFSLLMEIKRNRPDVIHAHWVFPQGLHAVILGEIFRVPVVLTAHGGDIFGLQSKLLRSVKHFALKKADRVTVVSSALCEKIMNEIPSITINVIPMGVSAELFMSKKRNIGIVNQYQLHEHTILFVGRLSEKKGVRYLIEAMPLVLKEFPSAHLLIVGSGELEASLKELVDKTACQENISFVGGVPNAKLPEYYGSSQIFVGPSITAKGGDTEGFGLTFVEASLSGCVLIGSDVGGVRDIIDDNRTGYLVPEKDSVAIAEKIIYALKNHDEVDGIIAQARNKCISEFDWQVVAKKYTDLLKRVSSTKAT